MLALHQPVAVDLRRIVAALMINIDLERMGDLAEDIAERAMHLAKLPHVPVPEQAAAHDRPDDHDAPPKPRCVRQSGHAPGPRCPALDDEVDRYNNEIIDEIVKMMKTIPNLIEAGPVAVLGGAAPGAHRRPRHQHRRGRGLPGGRRDHPASAISGMEYSRHARVSHYRRTQRRSLSDWPTGFTSPPTHSEYREAERT